MFWEKKQRSQIKELMNRNLSSEARDYLGKENSLSTKVLNQPSQSKVVSDQSIISNSKIKEINVPTEGKKYALAESPFVRFLTFLGYALGPWAVVGLITWFVLDSKSTLLLVIFLVVIVAAFVFVSFGGGGRGDGSNDQGLGQ